MRIVFFEFESPYKPLFTELERHSDVDSIEYADEPLTLDNVNHFADAVIISTLNESFLSEAVLAQLPKLKHIATRTTGFDHIPLDYCAQRGITISNVPHYGQQTVAEHAFALLLTLSHRLSDELARPKRGDFSPKGKRGFDLFGRTMGVIGTGNIGRNTVRIAKGFGMNVVAHDIRPDEALAQEFAFPYMSREELLLQSDIVTLHVPGDESTHSLIGRDEIALMKAGSILINTARGSVVDIIALADALCSGQLAGACLDVLPCEQILRNPKRMLQTLCKDSHEAEELMAIQTILDLPQAVVSPHTAYNTEEAIQRILRTTLENIQGYLDGLPVNCVGVKPAQGQAPAVACA